MRDEKGRFTSEANDAVEINYDEEIKAAETRLAELKQAQAAKLEEEKKAKALAKKAEAEPVQAAIDAYEAAKITCNTAIKAAYKEYQARVKEAEKALDTMQADADKKLNDFLANHPEGFHYTYKSPDGKVMREYTYYTHRNDVWDNFNKIQRAFQDLWSWES